MGLCLHRHSVHILLLEPVSGLGSEAASWLDNSYSSVTIVGSALTDGAQFDAEGRQRKSEAGRKETRVGCRSAESLSASAHSAHKGWRWMDVSVRTV